MLMIVSIDTMKCGRQSNSFMFWTRLLFSCSRGMKCYYICFKIEALIVQETFLNWYVNVAKKYFYTLSFYGNVQ